MRVDEGWFADYQRRLALQRAAAIGNVDLVGGPGARINVAELEQAAREPRAAPRYTGPRESAVLADVLAALKLHPAVAWVVRMNTGAFEVDGRYIRAGFRGCPDLWGQLTDGRLLVVEVKRPGQHPTEDQQATLDTVARNGGVAFVARSPTDVYANLPMKGRLPHEVL